MLITIDPGSAVAPYEQVRVGIAALARDGALPAGTRLPTVRQLAADLALAANTVARAYRELEQAGLVETRGRNGSFITARAAGVPPEAQRLATRYAHETQRLGLDPTRALGLVAAALGLPGTPGPPGPPGTPGTPGTMDKT